MKTANKQPLEYELKEDDIMYFLHIPKTAGTTLTAIIDNNFDLNSIYPEQVWQKLLLNKPKSFSEYKLIRGHFGYSLCKILPKKPVCITMIRDPVERTISFYHHMRTDPLTNNWVKDFISKENGLESLISNSDKRRVFANEQTRHLGLELDVFSLTESLDKSELENFFYESSSEFTDISDNRLLDIAKKHLSEFKFFGFTERFEESLMLLCYTFGWRPIRQVWKEMILPNRPHRNEFSDETINMISECTKLDSELYRYAAELFESRFFQMAKELKEKYFESHFLEMPFKQMMYELLEKNYNERFGKSTPPVSSIDFNFKQALNGSGWYSREFLPGGNVFRWTGLETKSTIDFHLARNSDLTVQFCVVSHIAPDILESLRLQVNGISIKIMKLEQENVGTVFEGNIPKQSLQTDENFVRFTFETNRTLSPNSLSPKSGDKRNLGLAFEWIKIIPHPV
ncbi:MAG: sulfotransferase family 2 domain-containing protein [Nitrosotalea sp.]